MKRKLLLFILVLCTFFIQQNLKAQTTLVPGDIAFIGYQTGTSTDGFSFITLKDMAAGTLVYFTEDGWGNDAWIPFNNEAHLLWTVPAFTPAGTIVSIVETAANVFTITGSSGLTTVLNTGFNLLAGDQILAYQAASVKPASPSFIAGIHGDYNSSIYDSVTTWDTKAGAGAGGGAESSLPAGLTNGQNCISLFPGVTEQANSKYTGTLTGTVAALLISINNPANWSHSAGAADLGIVPSSYPAPAVSTVVVATVSTNAATSVKAVSAVLGGNLSANGGDANVQRGIVWATTPAPTISNNLVQNGTGIGSFSATITGLPSASTIYYRAYATNTAGTSYGTELTFSTTAGLSTSSTPQTNINCNGGNNGIATVVVTGGTIPYSYSWSPSGGTGATASSLVAGTYTVTITDGETTQITRTFNITQPSVLNGTSSTTPVSCFGGSNGTATITPTGGAGGYTFLWSNGATTATASGLVAGTYNVTITDANSCTKMISGITVGGPTTALSGTASTTPVSCFGGNNGTATAVAIGGTGAKTYLWSNGATTATATSLTAGTYSVTITDANGCPFPISGIIVGQAATAVSGTISKTDVTCNGGNNGTATVTPAGGTPAYTYSWAPSGGTAATATGLVAGTYTVTITDANSCQTTETVTITQPSALVATPVAQTNIACHGDATGSATVSVTGGTGAYTYSWAPSGGTAATATGLVAGTYIVTVTDENGCFATQSFTINGPSAALSATTASTGVSCFSGSNGTASVTVSGGTPSYTYLWAPLGGTTSSITGRPAGNYTCTITDANGCTLVKNIAISTPSLVSLTTSKTDVSCDGGSNGSASVTASGGTPGYTYSWSPSGGTAASAFGLSAGTYTVTVTDANTCSNTATVTINQPSALTATTASTGILCNGQANGTATVIVSGGTPGYTYLWSPSGGTASTATGLAAGSYSCLITDANGCFLTKTFNISQPNVLNASTSQINATCITGGQAAVSPTGGTAPYNYLWSPSGATTQLITGLAAGNYSCFITDANGCTVTKNFNVTSTNTLVASTSQTNILCNGSNTGSASVVPSGAPGPYTYSWAPFGGNAATASNLMAGNYSVTITSSNGCSIVKNFTIAQPSAMAVMPSQTNILCNGATTGSASVSVTGGTGVYTYAWAPSGGTAATATGLAAGTYTVTVTDANLCQTIQSFTITEPDALTVTIAQTNVSCNAGTNGAATVTATGGTGVYTYAWAPTGGTAATATGLSAGTYTVTVTDANTCSTTQSVTITEPTLLIASVGGQTDVSCNGLNDGSATVNVTGGTGAYTYAWAPAGGTAATATGLSPGTYTVTVTDANSCTTTQNFTITEPTVLTAAITSQTDVSCNGGTTGSATVTAAGGTGTLTYAWAPSGGTADTATGLSAGTYTVTVTDANSCTATQNVTITEPNVLTATITPTNVSCNAGTNGAATVTASGGTGVYTYAWAPTGGTAATATGLSAGTYTVTVTDANTCSTTQSVTITEPTLLIASAGGQTNVSCNGLNDGSATVTATGGTGAYTYAWAPAGGTAATATGLSPGTYTVTVTDANSCTTTQNFTITEPTVLTAAITSQTDVSCNGGTTGSATVTATGGTGAYTYAWSPSGGTADTATGLSAGTYTVTVTDANSCTATQSVTITEPNVLTASITSTNVSCNAGTNGAATVTATGGTGVYTYAWAPTGGTAATATGLSAGTYTVTVTDANTCTTTQSITITEPTPLIASAGGQTDVSCNGLNDGSATVTATGGTGAYTYAWSPAGGAAATATGLSPGTYTVTVTDANTCTATQSFTITEPTILTAAITSQTNVTCNGQADGSATVTATGGTGAFTYAWSPSGGTAATATGLSAGTYTVTVTDANSCTATQSVTITEPNMLTATIAPTNVSCNAENNGSATVTATGGTGVYTYAWAPYGGTAATATGLSIGTYTVTVTDTNSCTTTQSVTLTEPTPLITSIGTQTNVSCQAGSNGAATVNVTGGTAPYSYAWGPSGGNSATASGLSAGTYTVTVTDANNCTATQIFNITEPNLLASNIASQINVSCSGLNNGAVIINVTGGVAPYTYLWSNGSTTKDMSGLAAGSYTLTITDANNCSATQSVTISTIADVTPPVPTVANLPEISNYCSVLAAQIPIPTATDNCAGLINATTISPLNYTTDGNYVITWSFDDGSGNISTQNQTVKVLNSLIDQVTFNDTEFTFDNSEHIIQVANLPAGASVVYSTVPATGTNNGATTAGIYAVTATISPSAATPNCSPVVLTANLTIKKAAQQITFGALAPRILGGNNDFNLQALSNSGLPIRFTFTYTSALPPANVSPSGIVSMLRSGELLITAHQDGNENYLPAASVSQLLIIKNSTITVQSITIGSTIYTNPAKDITYLMSCGENNPNIAIVNQTNATITPAASFSIATPKPGIYTQNITITSQDGTATAQYTIKVEKPFSFYDIVKQKFNNILLVNNNPLTNGGYVFVAFQWFKNGQLVGTGPYYSAGNELNSILDTSAIYSVKMTTLDGRVLQTCDATIVLQNTLEAKLYPNPIEVGKVITVEADFPEEELQNMQITLYSVSGKLIKTVQSSSVKTEIQLPETTGSNMYLVVLETANIKKSFKVIVK